MSFVQEDGARVVDDNMYQQAPLSPYVGLGKSANSYDDSPTVQQHMSTTGVLQLFRNLGNKLDQTIDLLGNHLVAQNNNIAEHTILIANIQQDHLNLHANVKKLQGEQGELRSHQSSVERENHKTGIVLEQIQKQVARLEAYNKKREQGRIRQKFSQGRGDSGNKSRNSRSNSHRSSES